MDGASAAAPQVEEAKQRIAHVPLVLNRRNFNWLTQRISEVVEQPAPRWWWVIFAITASAATFGIFCIGYQISTGVGTWGNQVPVGWAWDITNFVFWIGIGHAGTLISAILLLLRQKSVPYVCLLNSLLLSSLC
jgi:molybdopterin-containing oxidoreductase family membrane subunit